MAVKPYRSAAEYYQHHLQWIDAYLYSYLEGFTEKMHTSGKEHVKRGKITESDVKGALERSVLGGTKGEVLNESKASAEAIYSAIEKRRAATLEGGAYDGSDLFLPMEYLNSVFKLSKFERFAVLLSFATELDRKYEKIFAYFNDYVSQKYPTVQTACLIFDQKPEVYMRNLTRFYGDSKLMKYFFTGQDVNRSSMQLKLQDPIVNFLMDSELEAIVLPEFLKLYLPDEVPSPLMAHQGVQQKIAAYLKALPSNRKRRVVMNLHGQEGIGRLAQIKHYCHERGQSAVIMSMERLDLIHLRGQDRYADTLKELAQVLLMHQAVLVLTNCYIEKHQDLLKLFFDDFLMDHAPFLKVVFLLSDKPLPALTRPDQTLTVLRIELENLKGKSRQSLFEHHLLKTRKHSAADLTSLSSKFLFTPDQIENAVQDAVELARLEGLEVIDSHTFHHACRNQLSHSLNKRAQRIDAGGSWDQLILPQGAIDVLSEICDHVKYKSLVLDEWGFGAHLAYGTGLAVLFAGPPGTGKTFSARILAKELDLELYKVDLSQMISKYIGETEKNINALFDEAAGSSAILLFDEGDALFGKRTEMKDSHDRYANVETAFLLQKIEAYEGISILTTNFMQNIDPAFLRRFRFIVHYPIPDVSSRLEIWRGIYPDQVPLSKNIDFEFLAKHFELTGGHIKNIALSSAFKAASRNEKVAMKSIMQSIQHELGKTGRAVLRSDFGEYAYMLDS